MRVTVAKRKCLLWLVLTGLMSACGSGESDISATDGTAQDLLAAVKHRGKLRVALETFYRPGSFLDTSGNIIGFNPDVIEEVAERMGLDGVEYVEPAFEVIVAGNWQGRWDVAVHGITITVEREAVLFFTQPYVYANSYIAIHANNTTILDSTTDLDGKRIGTCSGCAQQRYLEMDLALPGVEIEFHIENADVRPYQGGTASAIEDLAFGDGVRLDAVLDEIDSICIHRNRGRPIKLVPDRKVMFSETSGLAFDANARLDATSLRNKIDQIIGDMHADGTLTEISKKWYDGWDRSTPGGFPSTCAL